MTSKRLLFFAVIGLLWGVCPAASGQEVTFKKSNGAVVAQLECGFHDRAELPVAAQRYFRERDAESTMFGDNLILGIFPSPVLLDNGRHVATASADVRIEVSKNKAKVQMRCSKVSVHDALFNWTRDYEPASTYPSTTGCDETMAVTSK